MSEILVVGGAGYIGSHVVLELLNDGQKVIILDDLSTGSQQAILGGTFYQGNMSDESLLKEIFNRHTINTVMLLAGSIDVSESVLNPMKYYHNNISNVIILLRQMIKHNIKHVIFSSTASIYGKEKNTITIDSKPAPQNPYARTKLMMEQILSDYDQAYGLKSCILRYFNAAGADPKCRIGFHEPTTHLIPLALKAASGRKKQLFINGDDYATRDGTCVRDYIHVMDLASAHLLATNHLQNTQQSCTFNLGNGKGYSVKEVISTTKQVTGIDFPVKIKPPRTGDPASMIADSSAAKKVLNWQPQYDSLAEIINQSWDWEHNKSWHK